MSKSLSGYGLPFSIVLMKPELDIWKPGEHNGTFRGNNHAFVTAKCAIDHYWQDDQFSQDVLHKGSIVEARLDEIALQYGEGNFATCGRGLFRGINCVNGDIASQITRACFKKGLIIETSGADDHIVKFLCPLIITKEQLNHGLDIVEDSISEACDRLNTIPEPEKFIELRLAS